MRDIVLTFIIGVLTSGALSHPWIGVLVWSWIGYMNPHRLCYGFAYNLPFGAIAGGATMFGLAITRESNRIPVTREVLLQLLLVLWFTVTTYLALNPDGPDGAWMYWNRVIKIQVMIVITLITMAERQRLHRLVWVIVLSIGFYGV